jgi:hypothetical protein
MSHENSLVFSSALKCLFRVDGSRDITVLLPVSPAAKGGGQRELERLVRGSLATIGFCIPDILKTAEQTLQVGLLYLLLQLI